MDTRVGDTEYVDDKSRVFAAAKVRPLSLAGNVFLIAGTSDDVPQVLAFLNDAGIETRANQDLYVRQYRQFGIDDAQELRTRAASHAIGKRRVFVISAGGMTSEAQNALLKTLEEPPGNALFIFIVPAPESLLATVRSRAQIITVGGNDMARTGSVIDVAAFLAAAPARRIEMLKVILEKDDDDKYDTGAMLAFLAALERHVAGVSDATKKREVLDVVYRARTFITDRGALVKTLLESVALLAPML